MKKAVVTGATGFIGLNVVKELVQNNIEVIALDIKKNNDKVFNNSLVQFYHFDLNDVFAVKNQINNNKKIDVFFHFAWAGSAGPDRANVELQLKNVKWAIDCLMLAKELGCNRFINAGSIMELETFSSTFKQGNKPEISQIYGSGKLASHVMCKAIAADIGIDLIWAIITNAYGIGEKSPRLINTVIQKCIKGETPKFTSGIQNYDFVYIDDVARAFRLIGEKGKPFCEYLIGSSSAKPLKNFLLELNETIAPNIKFVFGDIPFTGVSQPLSVFDCSKTERDTGFKAKIGFKDGCLKTYNWWCEILNKEGEK